MATVKGTLKKIRRIAIRRRRPTRIAVIGSGSWATAIVKILLDNDSKVNWFIRNQKNIDFIKKHKHNPNYLTSVSLNTDQINFYNDIEKVIEDSTVIFFAVPSVFLKETLAGHQLNFSNKLVVSAIKGIVPQDYLSISEFFYKYYDISSNYFAVISGPCHAEEIALEKLSYLTIACRRRNKIRDIASLMECDYVKTFVSRDIYGIEHSAILKNIVAIGAGICHGLGYGDNFQAVLVSNAIREMKRFLDAISDRKRTIDSSAYLGDLLVTCYSQFSRNRTFGAMIGKGYSVKSAQLEMNMIAEGYHASKCLHEINKRYKVDLPIIETVYKIVHQNEQPIKMIELLTKELH